MHVLIKKANYNLEQQNSYYVTKYVKRVMQGIDDFKHPHKNNQFSYIILFQFIVLTILVRLKTDT